MPDTSARNIEQAVVLTGNFAVITGISVRSSSSDAVGCSVMLNRSSHVTLLYPVASADISKGVSTMVNVPVDYTDRLRVEIPTGVSGKVVTVDLWGYEADNR